MNPRVPSAVLAQDPRVLIRRSVASLVAAGKMPSLRSISRLTGISRIKLGENRDLRKILEEGELILVAKRRNEVKMAVETLASGGSRVTIDSVASLLGRSYRYVSGSEELRSIVLTAS